MRKRIQNTPIFNTKRSEKRVKIEINAIATFPRCAFVCAFLLDTVSLTLFSPSLFHLVLLFIFRWCALVLALFPYSLILFFFFFLVSDVARAMCIPHVCCVHTLRKRKEEVECTVWLYLQCDSEKIRNIIPSRSFRGQMISDDVLDTCSSTINFAPDTHR